jgi:putative MATE family efflux protein
MQMQQSLTEGSIIKALIRISIPVTISNLLQTMYQITDTFWVGRLSAEAVAAVSLSFPISFLLIALGGGLPIAGSVLVAQYKGRGDEKAMNHVAAQTVMMVFAVSIVLTTIGLMFSEPIMRFMGAAPEVLPDAVRFLQVTFLGFLFVFGYFVFESLMRGLGSVRLPMVIVGITVLINFILDPLFIFGYGPIPAMGVSGAAMATLFTQMLACFIGYAMLFRGHHGIKLRVQDFRPDFSFIKQAFRIGFPASIEMSTRALGVTVMTILVASFGTIALAAYGIGIRFLTFIIIPVMGLSMATSALVGQNMGAGKVERAARTNTIAIYTSIAILILFGFIFYFLAEPFARFFVPEGGEAIAISATFIRYMCVTLWCIGVQMIIAGTFRGVGNTNAAMILAIVSQWVYQFPIAYILAVHTNLDLIGIWWSFTISNVLSAVTALVWYWRGDWKKRQLLDEVKLSIEVREDAAIEEGSVY